MSNSKVSNDNSISSMVEIDWSLLGTQAGVLAVEEHPFLGHINIRGSSDNTTFVRATKKILGVELPTQANTFVEKDENTILWLGPNEWLVVTAQENTLELITELEAALKNVFSAVNDVSGGNTILEVSGSKAQALLLKGCPLDLHHSVFSTLLNLPFHPSE